MSTATDTERPPHRPRHRWLAAIVVVLLIAIPAGYLAMSAWQSRESGEDKARSASARALIYEWPSKVQRRIYDVPIPDGSTYVGYYETNAWQRSTMYVQFRTTPGQLAVFLEEAGTERAALREGTIAIAPSQADVIGWSFDDPDRTYASTVIPGSASEPEVTITVDITKDENPRVYVVSTTEP
ncbi:hypothetical protein ACWGIB_03735 [Streptomyces xiamenensis]